ncbi:MAG: AzlC family ABC transporter permease [Ruminococcaceae bacterium]|nr:AzlC family ABC transporter permease [Oscillospiraceae bacterium]
MQFKSFKRGLIHGLPIALGYLAVSVSFGVSAVNMGLSVLEVLFISMMNMTSAGQLAGAPIIAGGGSIFALGFGQLFINLRYALMSVSLSQKFDRKVTLLDRFLIGFGVTDEIFAVSVSQKESVSKEYMCGLIVLPYMGWSLGTLIGALLGVVVSTYLPPFVLAALGIAIYGMFIAIVVPVVKKERSVMFCVLVAMLLSILCYYVPIIGKIIPPELHIVLCAVIASVVLAIFAPIKVEDDAKEGDK